MKDRFGKLRSENKIKNFWYLKQRSLKLETRIEQEMQQEVDSKYTVDDDNNDIMSFQSPFESIITNMFFDFC
ncbi:hypothetical protein RirG_155820 [Rhizophagus irregularis DAOM 197198w]|nr:hypothetical protein RirG_155820 [Rhizophagus irregularis DAOM 197198w]